MNEIKDALDSRLKNITFSQQMKNTVLEECKQEKKVKHKNRYFFPRIVVPITFLLLFCISFALAFKGLKSNEFVEDLKGEKALLKNNDVFSQYDVTGDGITDNVKVVIEEDVTIQSDSWNISIYVNDSIVFSEDRTSEPYWNVQLIKLKNGKVFFDIDTALSNNDACIHRLYAYEDDDLKCVYDFQKYYQDYAYSYSVNIVNVLGNTLEMEVYAQFYTTGKIQYSMNLDYKDGKVGYFESTSDSFTLKYNTISRENKWTANKEIKVYENVRTNKKAFTLKKGNIVKLNKIVFKDNVVHFQIEDNKGKIGYIVADKTYPDIFYFKETQFTE